MQAGMGVSIRYFILRLEDQEIVWYFSCQSLRCYLFDFDGTFDLEKAILLINFVWQIIVWNCWLGV